MNLDLKSNFLQKKKQEKKKVEQKQEDQARLLKIQTNLRAFLQRRRLQHQSLHDSNLRLAMLLRMDISSFPTQFIQEFVGKALQLPKIEQKLVLSNVILACLKTNSEALAELSLRILQETPEIVCNIVGISEFSDRLVSLVSDGKCGQIFELCLPELSKAGKLQKFTNSLLLDLASRQLRPDYIDTEGVSSFSFKTETILFLFGILGERKMDESDLAFTMFPIFSKVLTILLKGIQQKNMSLQDSRYGLHFLLVGFNSLLSKKRKMTIDGLIDKNRTFYNLVQDEQELEYFQNKMRQEPQLQEFYLRTLKYIQNIFHYQHALEIIMKSTPELQAALSTLIKNINSFYEPKNILFVYSFLSDEKNLVAMSKQKNPEFYMALKMKLMTMDDQQFAASKIFSVEEWRNIIESSIVAAQYLAKKLIMSPSNRNKGGSLTNLVPFSTKNEDEVLFATLKDMMSDLYKKCLRTKFMPASNFVINQLDVTLNKFTFKMGARSLEVMLKNFPYAFRFESRMSKFQEFIKDDKLNHDRSLFLQEEVDEDLIITVRRNHEFLDAYHSCMNSDLRKKYKIVFYNQQGLEEQGIDGGGIIKQFINRVLKSAFSDVFGMFYETGDNEILPNPACNLTQQYEFVGKLIGKAVYEGINIEQKFASPFLNLLIGRQNDFEELQFIDRQIYQSMVDMRRMQDVEDLAQTFTIVDYLPNGVKTIVNLKDLSGKSKEEAPVTNENRKEFLMSYADFKCNRQIEEKTRLFRRGFLKVMKSEWLTMFSNQELNQIISGGQPDFSVQELKRHVVFYDYHEKSQTITDLWAVLADFTPEQKSLFLLYITSCSRPPTLGFGAMKPLMCIHRSENITHLPTANTCMNVLRLPDYKNKKILKEKLTYAIKAKAGFQFA